jgi:hypothetical protein
MMITPPPSFPESLYILLMSFTGLCLFLGAAGLLCELIDRSPKASEGMDRFINFLRRIV